MINQPFPAVEDAAKGEDVPFRLIFESQPAFMLLLSPELRIEAVTEAYLQANHTQREEIIGKHLLSIYPNSTEPGDLSDKSSVQAVLEQVLSAGKPQKLPVLKGGLPGASPASVALERYWQSTLTPVFQGGQLRGILHESVEVMEQEKALRAPSKQKKDEQTTPAWVGQQRILQDQMFERLPAALAVLEGPELVFNALNESFQKLIPGRKLKKLPLFEALPELKEHAIRGNIQRVYETGETYEAKEALVPVARYEGQPPEDIFWNFVYQALHDSQGKVNGVLVFAMEVTEFVKSRLQVEQNAQVLQDLNHELEARVERRTQALRLAQLQTQKQKERLERLFTDAPAAICILGGPDLVYELVNPTYQQLFPERELLGKPILKALPEIKENKVYETFRRVYETGITHEEQELLIPFVRPQDGVLEDRYFRYIQQARFDENGTIDGILVLAFEITEQVKTRKAVEEGARRLQLITDSLPVLIGYLDKEQVYRFANKAYETWFPFKAESLLGRGVLDVVGEKAYQNVKRYIEQALAGERVDFDATMPYKDGFTKHIRTSYVPDIQDGQVAGFYTLVSDVSAQVEARLALEQSEQEAVAIAEELATANQELQNANRQLIHTNSDLDNFIYTASHDLRAPISNIEMLLDELLLELPPENLLNEDVDSILTMMKGSIDRFKKTINNLTEITRLQKDHLAKARLVDLERLVKEVTLDLGPLIQASGAQVKLVENNCRRLSFSEKNLRSIVYNLLSNAIKYRHPSRPPEIQISCVQEADQLVLIVQDNGLGLTATHQEQLFSMFRRFHDHVEGSGIGLYMVKRIVDNAGGRIEVDSTPGEGSTFRIYLRDALYNMP